MLVQPTGAVPTTAEPLARSGPAVGVGTRTVIAVLLILTAMRVDLFSGITLGTVAGLALAPVWVPRIRASPADQASPPLSRRASRRASGSPRSHRPTTRSSSDRCGHGRP